MHIAEGEDGVGRIYLDDCRVFVPIACGRPHGRSYQGRVQDVARVSQLPGEAAKSQRQVSDQQA
jgi:hypothetical protein